MFAGKKTTVSGRMPVRSGEPGISICVPWCERRWSHSDGRTRRWKFGGRYRRQGFMQRWLWGTRQLWQRIRGCHIWRGKFVWLYHWWYLTVGFFQLIFIRIYSIELYMLILMRFSYQLRNFLNHKNFNAQFLWIFYMHFGLFNVA